ncbi:MAG: ATP-binding protein [Syntrophorhabdales bacterium]|jgi:PAS domain S-box-containing protein
METQGKYNEKERSELRILMLGNAADCAETVQHELRQNNIAFVSEVVDTLESFVKALQEFSPDVVVSDYLLPAFDGLAALALVREQTSDTPFILVADAGGGLAVEFFKEGATDSVLKSRLGQLPAVFQRAVSDRDERRGRGRAEKEQKRLAEAVGTITEGVAIISSELTIEYVNHGLCRMTGYTSEELLGKSIGIMMGNGRDAGCDTVWERAAAGNVWAGRFSYKRKDGIHIIHETTVSSLRDGSGTLTGYVAVSRDVSHEERLERQLRQAQKMEALNTLCGGVAHYFNNILAVIIGFTELVADHVEKGGRDEGHLRRVMEASIRGREMVRQLLAFSRKAEQKKLLFLSTMVKETARLLRATAPTAIRIRVRTAGESGPILGDPTQISQIFMNLCTNAVHAMREKGGVLDIEVSDFSVSPSSENDHGMEPGLYAKLVVRDTGIGIEPGIIDRIFDPFFTTKQVGEGIGLGLFVVHGIVKQSNGYITVESEPGRGSTFTVYLPVGER